MNANGNERNDERPATVFVEGIGELPVEYGTAVQPPEPVYPDDVLSVADHVVARGVGDETVLFDPRESDAHVLNSSASLLWNCLDGAGSVREIFADLADAFGVPVGVIEHDFVPLLSDWKRHQLVVTRGIDDSPGVSPQAVPTSRYLVDPPNS